MTGSRGEARAVGAAGEGRGARAAAAEAVAAGAEAAGRGGCGCTLEARDVSFSYRAGTPVLARIAAEIVPGSFLAILGVNGSGKSTLMACLDDMLSPDEGAVLVDGIDLSTLSREERARRIAFVAQHSHAGRLAVYDALLLGRRPYARSAPGSADFGVVDEVIARTRLDDLALRYVDELSGGEYQKVVIARAFVQQTGVLLLDEPTNSLDMANQAEVMGLVRRAVDEEGIAAAAVMHDVNLALRYCDRFLMVKGGSVAAAGGPEVVTEESIAAVYGVRADIVEHKGMRVVVPLPADDGFETGEGARA